MHCTDQLQRAVERQEYSEAAHLLEAVQQLSLHFQSFAQIPKVNAYAQCRHCLDAAKHLKCKFH